jgi:hypothetical protein
VCADLCVMFLVSGVGHVLGNDCDNGFGDKSGNNVLNTLFILCVLELFL